MLFKSHCALEFFFVSSVCRVLHYALLYNVQFLAVYGFIHIEVCQLSTEYYSTYNSIYPGTYQYLARKTSYVTSTNRVTMRSELHESATSSRKCYKKRNVIQSWQMISKLVCLHAQKAAVA